MNLRLVHQILIASAIGLAALFAIRSAALFARGGQPLDLAIAIGALAVAAALGLYLRSVRAKWAKDPRGASRP